MVARFRCLILGEMPSALSPQQALRSGIDGVIVPSTSSVIATQSYPYAIHLAQSSEHELVLDGAQHLPFDGRPLVVVEPTVSAADGVSILELRRSQERMQGPRDSFPFVRFIGISSPDDLQTTVAEALRRSIQATLTAGRENALLVLDEWDGWNHKYLQALTLGLVHGASALPPKPLYAHWPRPAFSQ